MKTFEYRLRPTKRQEEALLAVLIGSRRLYNECLEEIINHYEETGKYLHIYEQDKRHGKSRHPDLPAVVVDATLKRVHRSFGNFFRGIKEGRKAGFPRFKGPNRWDSFSFRDSINHLDGHRFIAPRICGGSIRAIVHRPLEGEFKFARIVKRPSGWYVQCVCETDPNPLPENERAIGLDMGITYLLADSEGGFIKNPKSLKSSLKRLSKAQRVLSRRKKGSRRRDKARKKVARIHEKIVHQREDALHKASRHYVNAYQMIAIEDLRINNLMRNHSLAMSIGDASWGRLRWYLACKAEEAGRELIAVPPQYTSQKCSRCGEYVPKALSVRTHICPQCGYLSDRDTNAARNILRKARTRPSGSFGEGRSDA